MDECTICGHPAFRSEHADWCEGVAAWLAELYESRPHVQPPVCAVDGCERLSHGRGMCSAHYSAWWRSQRPTSVRLPAESSAA